MEEDSPLVRRAKSAILMLIFVAIVIFPLFQDRKEFFDDRVGDPEIQLLPNTDKMRITLFPTKGKNSSLYFFVKITNTVLSNTKDFIRRIYKLILFLAQYGTGFYSILRDPQNVSSKNGVSFS